MNSRGFITLPLMAWGAIAAGAVILTLGVALKWQSSRLETCHIERTTEKALFSAKLAEYDAKLAEQNKTIEQWQDRAVKAAQAGQRALAEAKARGKGLQAEADRLRAEKGKGKPSECPAGDAVKQLRKGLG